MENKNAEHPAFQKGVFEKPGTGDGVIKSFLNVNLVS
jgi:hypothetical protein